MYKVKIINYESIGSAEIEIEGFTSIIGRNHLGKSSILRAINAALTNQSGSHFIKWGETFCEVHIQGPGLDLIWHKEEGNNFYKINGSIYKKTGRNDPPEEIEKAGFKILKFGNKKIDLNYARQFNQLFLVDHQEDKNVDLLTSIYGLDRLYKAIDLCNKEQRENRDILNLRLKDFEQTKDDLEKYKKYEEVKSTIHEIKNLKEIIIKKENEIEELNKYATEVEGLLMVCKRLHPSTKINVPDDKKISCNISEYRVLKEYCKNLEELKTFINTMSEVVKIEIPAKSVRGPDTLMSELNILKEYEDQRKYLVKEIEKLEPIDKMILPELPPIDSNLNELISWVEILEEYKKSLLEIKRDLNSIEPEIVKKTRKIQDYSVCPACGSDLKNNL